MFIALEIPEKKPGGLFDSFLNLFARPGVFPEAGSCLGARFTVLKARAGRKGVDWDAVASACSRYANRVLLPDSVAIPDGCNIKTPSLPEFRKAVLVKTACTLISRTRMPMYLRTLGLIDPDAACIDTLGTLLMYFTAVRVVTNRQEAYLKQADRIMDELGAPVLVSDSLSSLAGAVLALSPSSFETERELPFNCPVIADGPFHAPGRYDLISALRVDPGERISAHCPGKIDLHMFTGALYEFCGMDNVAQAATTFFFNHKITDPSEVVQKLIQNAGLDPRSFA